MSKYTLGFADFMNEGISNSPKSRVGKMLDESDAKLLKALEEIENEESKTEPEKVKEELAGHAKKMKEDGVSDEEIKKMHPEVTDKDLEEEYIYETPVEKAPEPAIKYETPLAEPLQEAFDGYKLFNDKNLDYVTLDSKLNLESRNVINITLSSKSCLVYN